MAIHPLTHQAVEQYGNVLRVERRLNEEQMRLKEFELALPTDVDKRFYAAECEAMRSAENELRGRQALITPR